MIIYIDLIFNNEKTIKLNKKLEFNFINFSFIDLKQEVLRLSNGIYKTIDDFNLFSKTYNQDFTENSFLYYRWNYDTVIRYNCLIVNDKEKN